MTADQLCEDFESALGCPYVSPGASRWSGIRSGVDCSGLFTAAAGRHGVTLPHGSNAIARSHTQDMTAITQGSRPVRGMAVFMWQQEGAPAKYTDGKGNYHHMGLVTSVSPLRVIHASASAGQVVCASSLKGWTHMARLTCVDMNDKEDIMDVIENGNSTGGTLLQVTAIPSLRVRKGPGLSYEKVGSLASGARVTGDRLEKGWYHLADDSGWVSAAYVRVLGTQEGQSAQTDRLTLLEQRVAALEALHREEEGDA